jgi:hypothetical protein
LYDNPLGIACGKAIKQSLADGTDDKVRISIAFLDWKHSHGNMVFERKSLSDICPACKDGVGDKTFLSGQLIHLAFTRVPVNRRTDVEVDLSMTIKTQTDDAESIVGKELAEDLEAKKKSLVSQSEAVVIRSDTVATPPAEEINAQVVEEEAMFADPKNKKYPIDDEKHIRAAWSYIHMPRNQKGYTPEEVKAIEGKIVSAWKKVIDKAGPAEAKKGMLLMSTVIENMDMGMNGPTDAVMYLPYDGAVTFQQADDYLTAQEARENFYDDWYTFNSLAGNIMNCGDVTDKMGAMAALVGEFKNRLDQSIKDAVTEMSLAIKELRKPVAPPHPLDDTVSALKAQFTEVSSNPALDRNGKLELIQQSFVQVGEAIKGAIPESEVQPVVEAPVVPGALDVETLRSAFAEAMAPLMQTLQIQNEKISQLQQQSSAVVGTNLTRQVIPTRRSIDPALVKQSTTQTPVIKPGSLKDIIRKSVFGADGQSG